MRVFLESVREALFNYHGVDNLAGANEEKCGLAWPSSKTIPQRRENCKLILFSLFSQLFRSNLYLDVLLPLVGADRIST